MTSRFPSWLRSGGQQRGRHERGADGHQDGTRDHGTEDHGTEDTGQASETDVTPLHHPLVDSAAVPDAAADERRLLLQLCLYALDRARSTGVAERLEDGLAQVGVTALRPDGDRFDPAVHEAGGTLPTDDPALDGVIAETEVPGFADRGTLLRAPIVTVYTVR